MGLRARLVLALTLLHSLSANSAILTCEQIAALVARNTYQAKPEDHRIQWPRSISRGSDFQSGLTEELAQRYQSAQTGSFTGTRGASLPYRIFPVTHSKGAIVIVHGMTESIVKWMETIRTLNLEGYTVYMYEQRGHGGADREATNPQTVHVRDYADYVGDLKIFVDTIVTPGNHPRRYILGNSMGGLVSTLYAHQNPGIIDAMATLVPAYEINLKGIPEWVARGIVGVKRMLGTESGYASSKHDFNESQYRTESPTLDRNRMENHFANLHEHPATRMGGPSFQWIGATLKAIRDFRKVRNEFQTPIMIIGAGKDVVIPPDAITKIASDLAGASHYFEPDATHRFLSEGDDLRNPMLTDMLRYFVNPIPLNKPAEASELPHLLAQAESYFSRKEPAFARYALDEIDRVMAWKADSLKFGVPGQFRVHVEALRTQVLASLAETSLEELGLYQFLTYQRKQELLKIYKKTQP